MGEKGHFEELQKLLEMIQAESTGSRQNFVMSATLSLVHKPPAYSKGNPRNIFSHETMAHRFFLQENRESRNPLKKS